MFPNVSSLPVAYRHASLLERHLATCASIVSLDNVSRAFIHERDKYKLSSAFLVASGNAEQSRVKSLL